MFSINNVLDRTSDVHLCFSKINSPEGSIYAASFGDSSLNLSTFNPKNKTSETFSGTASPQAGFTGDTLDEAFTALLATVFHSADVKGLSDIEYHMIDCLLAMSDSRADDRFAHCLVSKTPEGRYRSSWTYVLDIATGLTAPTPLVEGPALSKTVSIALANQVGLIGHRIEQAMSAKAQIEAVLKEMAEV